jgi:hypothetical protein
MSGKILLFSEKIMIRPETFVYVLKSFEVANISWKNFLGALFFRKMPIETCPPPQLFYASFAPGSRP